MKYSYPLLFFLLAYYASSQAYHSYVSGKLDVIQILICIFAVYQFIAWFFKMNKNQCKPPQNNGDY